MKNIMPRYLVISILIMLVLVFGVAYAYWTAIIEGEGTPMVFETVDNLKIVFTEGETIGDTVIEPGWKYTKTFTVENQSINNYSYNIVLKDLINTFVINRFLRYRITSDDGYNMTKYRNIPRSEVANEIPIAYSIDIPGETTHHYTIEFYYENSTSVDQSADMGSRLSGRLGITKGTIAPTLYKVLTDGVNYPTVKTRKSYSTIDISGVIYKTVNEMEYEEGEEIYYFAGNPSDNWVKFGTEKVGGEEKDIYWRIIRTNSDKSVRLLYAGNTPETTEGYIKNDGVNEFTTLAFNTKSGNTMYVGWKYGTEGSLDGNRTNENSSNIRDAVLGWYNMYLDKDYGYYINKNAIYCNDRSGGTYALNHTYYTGFMRLHHFPGFDSPTYQCGMNTTGKKAVYIPPKISYEDYGTMGILNDDASDLDKFKDGVGLMTADEITFAGGRESFISKDTYYSRNSVSDCSTIAHCSVTGENGWWTMTPVLSNNSYGVRGSSGLGYLTYDSVSLDTFYTVRPVISIDYETYVTGSGTVIDPYVVIGL